MVEELHLSQRRANTQHIDWTGHTIHEQMLIKYMWSLLRDDRDVDDFKTFNRDSQHTYKCKNILWDAVVEIFSTADSS